MARALGEFGASRRLGSAIWKLPLLVRPAPPYLSPASRLPPIAHFSRSFRLWKNRTCVELRATARLMKTLLRFGVSPLFTCLCTGLLLAPALRAAVVTTADNASPAGDGQTSLLEALSALSANESITFNIPGTGPHYLVTPPGGYPLITGSGVTIDGYSQPGALPNTAAPRTARNARIEIVLDSRTSTPGERRTVLNYPGYGASESCILGLLDAQNVTIRGLAFIGETGIDNPADPQVYNIALVKESKGAKVQGCWFGLDPRRTSWVPGSDGVVAGVHGARSAVASFRWTGGLNSSGLIFGTDGDGAGDAGEGNICMGQLIAVHLETPGVRVSGNWFNFFPDGSVLRPETQNLPLPEGTLEAIENGFGGTMLIGTDGNGVSDAEEGNVFGPVRYTVFVEFWRAAQDVVFAGNSAGLDLHGFPAFSSTGTGLIFLRKDSSIRIGSDLNGVGDSDEANHIGGIRDPFIRWSGTNNDANGKPARVSLRRNELIGNAGAIPLAVGVVVTPQRLFADAMSDPLQPDVILSPASTTTLLAGLAPPAAAGLNPPVLDVYLADASGLYEYAPQGRVWLGSYAVDGAGDLDADAGEFAFDVSALGLTGAELVRITATANYTLADGRVVTSDFSQTLAPALAPPALTDFRITRAGTNVMLDWTDGTAPFAIFTATDLAGPWSALATIPAPVFATPMNGPRRFFRIYESASPR